MILIAVAILSANPESLNSVFATAGAGDTIRLAAGHYPQQLLQGRTFDPPLTIDARAAQLDAVQVLNSTGVRWTGGTISGNPTLHPAVGYGFIGKLSAAITVIGVHFSDLRDGVFYDRVDGGEVRGNWFVRMATDGVDLALSRRIVVADNTCSEFERDDNSHPDCIQLWSRPNSPPVADVTITGNTMVGTMQGISLFNHIRDGVDDGGFDRIVITNNSVLNVYSNGIAVYDCRGCSVRYNHVASLPNYINIAQLYISGGSVELCGNIVVRVPRQAGPPCPR